MQLAPDLDGLLLPDLFVGEQELTIFTLWSAAKHSRTDQRNGHEVVAVVADHKTGKSHLWDRKNLKPWVTDPELLSQYDAIVALKVDRLTRADDEGVDAMKDWARRNHKSPLISSAEVRFPSEGLEGAMWDMYIRMAHAEWLAIRERYVRMQDLKHEAGSLVGPPPWGYEVVLVDGIKLLEPTADGRIWIPRIFAWVIEGRSLRWISKELNDAGVPTRTRKGHWYEPQIAGLVKRRTYSGGRVRKGRAPLPVEALVDSAVQDAAVAALNTRGRLGRASTTKPKALLAKLKCGHPDCAGQGAWPMYRGGKDAFTTDALVPRPRTTAGAVRP